MSSVTQTFDYKETILVSNESSIVKAAFAPAAASPGLLDKVQNQILEGYTVSQVFESGRSDNRPGSLRILTSQSEDQDPRTFTTE